MVIKLQSIEPDTCATGEQPCRLIQRFDTDATPRVVETVGIERTCSAHTGTFPANRILWADGNWKSASAYITYQRDWFRWRNLQQWQQRVAAGENIGAPPPQIASFTTEPATSGSVPAPSAGEVAGLNQIATWNASHNARKNLTLSAVIVEYGRQLEDAGVTWSWAGVGDARVLTIRLNGILSTQKVSRVQNAADIQFGPGRVVIQP